MNKNEKPPTASADPTTGSDAATALAATAAAPGASPTRLEFAAQETLHCQEAGKTLAQEVIHLFVHTELTTERLARVLEGAIGKERLQARELMVLDTLKRAEEKPEFVDRERRHVDQVMRRLAEKLRDAADEDEGAELIKAVIAEEREDGRSEGYGEYHLILQGLFSKAADEQQQVIPCFGCQTPAVGPEMMRKHIWRCDRHPVAPIISGMREKLLNVIDRLGGDTMASSDWSVDQLVHAVDETLSMTHDEEVKTAKHFQELTAGRDRLIKTFEDWAKQLRAEAVANQANHGTPSHVGHALAQAIEDKIAEWKKEIAP